MIDIRIFDLMGFSSIGERVLVKSIDVDKGHIDANFAYQNAAEGLSFIEDTFNASYINHGIDHLYILINDGEAMDHVGFKGRDIKGAQYLSFGPGNHYEFINLSRSPDIMCHELTHLFMKYHIPLSDMGQTGAIEEHFADVVGISFANKQRVFNILCQPGHRSI